MPQASAKHIPDATAALDKLQAMSDAARALQDAAVAKMQPGAQHVDETIASWVIAGQDKALAALHLRR